MPEPGDYEHLNVDELKDLAKEAGLEGYSTLNRDPIIKLLVDNDVEPPAPDDEDEEEGGEAPQDEEEEVDDTTENEEEAPDDEDSDDGLQEVRVHAGHPSSYEFLEGHLDHEVRDYKRYTVEVDQDTLDDLLDDPGQPFVTPLA